MFEPPLIESESSADGRFRPIAVVRLRMATPNDCATQGRGTSARTCDIELLWRQS